MPLEPLAQSDVDEPLAGARVLVLAPLFPSLNQPWMDTYVQQLGVRGVRYAVLSRLATPLRYQSKVDALGLNRYRVVLGSDRANILRSIVVALLNEPIRTIRRASISWACCCAEASTRARLGAAMRALSMASVLRRAKSLRVIHAHCLQMGYEAIASADDHQLPMVLTFHGLEPAGNAQVPVSRRTALFRRSEVVLVNTEFARHHAIELGCPEEKLVILPQGLPVEEFPWVERAAPVHGKPLTLLSVGRFHRDKGQRYSLLALARLQRLGIPAHWHFAGVGPDMARLRRFAEKLGVTACTTFHDGIPIEELRKLYQTCHLFVLSSVGSSGGTEHVETQGVVIQEAQASGCIPIATRIGGIPECITDGHDGLLVQDRSHRDLVRAITQLLAEREAWPAYQRNGRHTVETRFSADVVGRRMAEILREVAGHDLAYDDPMNRERTPSKS
jgi:glycosyltransferase involved in cell wall biosynthesis